MKPLVLSGITKHFGEHTAVDHLDLEVEQGEIYGLLGANGAGKTTSMRMVLGLIYPDEGEIKWNGNQDTKQLSRMMGYLPEERGLYPKIKVSEQINYFAQLRGMSAKDADDRLKQWLERFEVPDYYDKKIEELSKGNQQKIQFIAAVIHDPQFLVLDEAFSGLDPVNVELLKKTVKELSKEGTTILFSTHRMEHVEELCKNISILHRSKTVLQGNLREIKQTFSKERVMLSTEKDVLGLEHLPGVINVNKTEETYDIRINDITAAKQILKLAMDQTEVHRFEIMEPTLNEIFIKAVGGEHDA